MQSVNNRKKSFLWVVLIPFIIYCLHLLLFGDWLSDDAGISFAYARNFIHGHGFVSQVGAEPLEGFSNFLWTLLLSPLFLRAPVDPTVMVKVFSALFILIAYIFIYTAIYRNFKIIPYKDFSIFIILLLLSINSSFVIWTSSGLENPLYVMLAVLYFLLILEYNRSDAPASRLPMLIALVVTLLALTRPDGVLFAVVFPVYLAFTIIFKRYKFACRHLFIYFIFFVLFFGSFLLFRCLYFHDLFPNTYYAKSSPGIGMLLHLVFLTKIYVIKSYDLLSGIFSWRAGILSVLLLVISTAVFIKSRSRRENLVLLLMLLTTWAIYILLPNDWMGEFRFATPFFVFLYIYLWIVFMQFVYFFIRNRKLRQVIVLITVLFLVATTTGTYVTRSAAFVKNPSAPFKTIALRYGIRFNDYADLLKIEKASLLCPDMGGTLYFSRHRVYDLAGLCDRKIAKLIDKDKQGLKDYVFENLKPTFIHIHDIWSIKSGFEFDYRFRRDYLPLTETVSRFASTRSPGRVYYSGDYVRRDALPDAGLLEKVKEYLTKIKTQQMNTLYKRKAKPFPRG